MPSNADVNVIPAKMTTSGDAAGYVKINNNNFEIVSQIPAADVESSGGTVKKFTAAAGSVTLLSNRWRFAITIPNGVTINTVLRITVTTSESDAYIAFIPTEFLFAGNTFVTRGYALTSYAAAPAASAINLEIVYV